MMSLQAFACALRVPAEEGWDVFDSGIRGLEIERDDEAEKFESDEEAVRFVRKRARDGSALHQLALAIHQRNKKERRSPCTI